MCVHSEMAVFGIRQLCNEQLGSSPVIWPGEAEKGDSCVRKQDFRNRKERVTNLGEGSNFSGLGWGKPSRRTSFSVTFYNPIILSKSSIS